MQLEVGSIVEGKVTGITKFGAFIELPEKQVGMVHISEVAHSYVKEIKDFLTMGQMVKVKVLAIGEDGKISLSVKQASERKPEPRPYRPRPTANAAPSSPRGYEWQPRRSSDSLSFEDMMSKFKQTSDEKLSDLKRTTESKRGSYQRRGGSGSK